MSKDNRQDKFVKSLLDKRNDKRFSPKSKNTATDFRQRTANVVVASNRRFKLQPSTPIFVSSPTPPPSIPENAVFFGDELVEFGDETVVFDS